MTLQEQLAQSQQPTVLVDFFSPAVAINAGLVGNGFGQMLANADSLMSSFPLPFNGAETAFKLTMLKRQKFSAEGREQRITASMQALNAPQPTELSLSEWKEIVEVIEDDED
jgi:hypothetical protein